MRTCTSLRSILFGLLNSMTRKRIHMIMYLVTHATGKPLGPTYSFSEEDNQTDPTNSINKIMINELLSHCYRLMYHLENHTLGAMFNYTTTSVLERRMYFSSARPESKHSQRSATFPHATGAFDRPASIIRK
jgi:hypothetical protein